ncbi:MAG: BON domain-containing protein [Xanthomonadales bacterium]|nr:BON domain-containing protein [Xanthomonadales bacterium]
MKSKILIVLTLALAFAALGGCSTYGKSRTAGEYIDDKSIATRTKTALLADSVTDGLNIDVEVDRDRVQLNGFVDSQAQVDRAGEIARSISNVVSVENNLKVSEGDRMTGEYIDDNVLQARVNAALINDPITKSLRIDVEVNRGEVSLGGFVDSDEARAAAVATTQKTKGVIKVINNLTVR